MVSTGTAAEERGSREQQLMIMVQGRSKPGLRPHLTGLKLVESICGGTLQGECRSRVGVRGLGHVCFFKRCEGQHSETCDCLPLAADPVASCAAQTSALTPIPP